MLKSQIHEAAHCAALNECDSCESARSNLYVMIELSTCVKELLVSESTTEIYLAFWRLQMAARSSRQVVFRKNPSVKRTPLADEFRDSGFWTLPY